MPALITLDARPLAWLTYVGLICVISFLCFGHVAEHGLTDYDDFIYLTQAASISGDFWTLFDAIGIRPTTYVVAWLGYEIWGDAPGWYHMLSILVHTVASVLIALVCRQLGVSLQDSFVAGAMFLTTVSHFRAVLVISSLSYPVGLTFGLLVLWLFRRHQSTNTSWPLVVLPMAGALAALAHPAVVSVLGFCIYTAHRRGECVKATVVRLLPTGVVSLGAVFCLVYFYPDSIQTYQSVHVPDASRIAEHILWLLSRLITTAHWLPLAIYEYHQWELGIGCAGVCLLVLLIVRGGRGPAEWSVWILLTTVPFANRLQSSFHQDTSGPSNYLYMASVGVSVLMALLLGRTGDWVRNKYGMSVSRASYAAAVAITLWYSAVQYDRLQAYLFYEAGKYKMLTHDVHRAADLVREAIEHDSGLGIISRERAYTTTSLAVLRTGDSAAATLQEALTAYPAHSGLRAIWGVTQSLQPDSASHEEGLAAIRSARRATTETGVEMFDLFVSRVYQFVAEGKNRKGDYESARIASMESLKHAANARSDYNMGVAEFHLRNYEAALASYRRVADLDGPDIPELHSNMGLAFARLGRLQDALQAYQTSIELDPEIPVVHYNMGLALTQLGRSHQAIDAFDRVVGLSPGDADAHFRLALAYMTADDMDAARDHHEILQELDADLAARLLGVLREQRGDGVP